MPPLNHRATGAPWIAVYTSSPSWSVRREPLCDHFYLKFTSCTHHPPIWPSSVRPPAEKSPRFFHAAPKTAGHLLFAYPREHARALARLFSDRARQLPWSDSAENNGGIMYRCMRNWGCSDENAGISRRFLATHVSD